MAFTIDASVLIAAANARDARQPAALEAITRAASGSERFFLFWPTVAAYLRVLTTIETARRPLTLEEAWTNIDSLMSLGHCATGGEPDGFGEVWKAQLSEARAIGKFVHDAHLVALMRCYELATIWTYDRDFRRFDGIRVVEPGN